MKIQYRFKYLIWGMFLTMAWAGPGISGEETIPESQVLMKAMVTELNRSMDLQMEDLEKPYFIQYAVEDSLAYQLSASCGAVTGFNRDRSRDFNSLVRVGSYELDNTNFSGGGGGRGRFSFGGRGGRRGGGSTSLPLDDDYTAIRQAIWWATDWNYKSAVENLTQKRAYMRDKTLEDRPDDFARSPAVEHMSAPVIISFDRSLWEERLKTITARFKRYSEVQDSGASLVAGMTNRYLVNTEGTRLMNSNAGAMLRITAHVQADDGMKISDGLTYYARYLEEIPAMEKIVADMDKMVENLQSAMKAPILESYTGPVLFDGFASAQLFQELFSRAVAGQVEPMGTQRSRRDSDSNLETKLGQRILPKSMNVYDDPTVEKVGDTMLLGHYDYDDEGVAAQRVNLVEKGRLEDMVMSRVPTKKMSVSNGHGRGGSGGGNIRAAIGSLFIEDEEGLTDAELKEALIEAARDEGLEYGLHVVSIRSAGMPTSQSDIMSLIMNMGRSGGGGSSLGDPILIYKVNVEDGREEMVRGCEFGSFGIKELKDILACGSNPVVYNYIGIGMWGSTPASTIVSPAILAEEVELTKIDQELPKQPIMKAPIFR